MTYVVRVTSSVLFVSELDRSIEFYRDVLSCEVSIRDREAALLIAPGGFQLYLIGLGTSATHPSRGIGFQYLIWAVENDRELRDVARAIEERGARTTTHTSGGVVFVAGRDPNGIRILVAYPGPEKLPRSIVGAHLYA